MQQEILEGVFQCQEGKFDHLDSMGCSTLLRTWDVGYALWHQPAVPSLLLLFYERRHRLEQCGATEVGCLALR